MTDKAKEELKKLLLSRSRDHEASIRLAYGSVGELGLLLSRERDGDEAVQYEGSKVLLIAGEFVSLLDGVRLDVKNDGSGRAFVMFKK